MAEEIKWIRGYDFKHSSGSYMVYGITKVERCGETVNAIDVYSSGEDRDLILKLLQGQKEGVNG